MMYPVYMPYTEDQLGQLFADVKINGLCNPAWEKHLKYYKSSLENYNKSPKDRKGKPLNALKIPCQVEKDEMFWVIRGQYTYFPKKRDNNMYTV